MNFHGHDGNVYHLSNLPVESTRPEYLHAKLSRIYRFQGQPRSFSVAQHLALCAQLALNAKNGPNVHIAAMCLTHDLAEAFLGDWHGRFKVEGQRAYERKMDQELHARGWLMPWETRHTEVKTYDIQARNIERQHIWPEVYGEPDVQIETDFLSLCDLLGAYGGK